MLDPIAVPPPIDRQELQRVQVALESVELTGILADGTTYQYWTFNQHPAPGISVAATTPHQDQSITGDLSGSVDVDLKRGTVAIAGRLVGGAIAGAIGETGDAVEFRIASIA